MGLLAGVHKVLCHLKTSGTVLQTALCHIEAIQSKVPKLLFLERQGLGVKGELMPAAKLFPLPKLPPDSTVLP
jgi:hypothetical protein